jgi:hypothetical protein
VLEAPLETGRRLVRSAGMDERVALQPLEERADERPLLDRIERGAEGEARRLPPATRSRASPFRGASGRRCSSRLAARERSAASTRASWRSRSTAGRVSRAVAGCLRPDPDGGDHARPEDPGFTRQIRTPERDRDDGGRASTVEIRPEWHLLGSRHTPHDGLRWRRTCGSFSLPSAGEEKL